MKKEKNYCIASPGSNFLLIWPNTLMMMVLVMYMIIIHVSHQLERLGITLHVPTLQESALFGTANTIMMYSAKGAFCLRSLT